MKKCIILANGTSPNKSLVTFLQKKGYATLICADGGANTAADLDLMPDYIVGDFDSITPENYLFFLDKCKLIQIKRQNDTDVEKCLKYVHKHNFSDVILLGATGDRLDHSFCNLGIVLKYSKKMKIRIIHDKSILEVISGNITIPTIPDETISIYGFDRKTKISSNGLKYRLKNISLPFGEKESTSNKAISSRIELKITGGMIFIIRDFETMRENDLF